MTSKTFNIRIRYLMIISFLIISLYSMKGVAMSLLFGTEVVLFSPMEGKITFEGKPAANAKIIVHVFWKDDVGEKEEFQTNENGEFNIPIKKTKVRIPPLAEFVVTQQVSVIFKSESFVIWSKATSGTDEYGGLGGNPKNVRCELTEKRKKQENFSGLFSTSCRWDLITTKGD